MGNMVDSSKNKDKVYAPIGGTKKLSTSTVNQAIGIGLPDQTGIPLYNPNDTTAQIYTPYSYMAEDPSTATYQARKEGEKRQQYLLDELNRQQTLGKGYISDYASRREQNIREMADLLASSQKRQLMDRVPELAEQANLSGIFRSTGTGEAIAREASKLAAATSEQLGQYGLAQKEANLSDLQKLNDLNLQGRYSALEANTGLSDLALQAKIAKETGVALQQPVKSGKGQGALTGAIGGAGAGAAAGGIPGAITGGLLGLVGGGQLGGK